MTNTIEQTIVASMQAEIERLQDELAQTKVAATEPLYDDERLNDAFEDVGFAEYAADAFSAALVDAKRVRDAYEVEIRRLQAASNTVDQYWQIQDCQNGKWHTLSQRFSLDEKQQARDELAKWRERFPVASFRPVIITVALLVPEEATEQES